ncbi:MAG: tetratricopeptide repeat protein [Gammaproteobacteria bacterium]|nr:tetratricopeptide repeat protein [Gammaproteobacteria bacterium]
MARTSSSKAKRIKAGSSPSAEALEALMRQAVAHHHAGRYSTAAKGYREVLTAAPDHAAALSSLAMIESRGGRHQRAIHLLQRAVAADDSNPGHYMNLGAVLAAAARVDDAAKAYQRAIHLQPNYADPYYNLGDLHLRAGRPDAAVEVFAACEAARGRDYLALAYRVHALRDAGRDDEAHWLLDYERYLMGHDFDAPEGYADLAAFNAALAEHVSTHPTLRGGILSTENGKHTAELLDQPPAVMRALEASIHRGVRAYMDALPDDPEHPAVKFRPQRYRLSSWGVVMNDRGHERAHVHPNGWLSGVLYLELPAVIDDPDRHPEGWLEFGRPTAALGFQRPPELRHARPGYGRMWLFPSFFYHGTVPFRSQQRRICIAFDVEPAP